MARRCCESVRALLGGARQQGPDANPAAALLDVEPEHAVEVSDQAEPAKSKVAPAAVAGPIAPTAPTQEASPAAALPDIAPEQSLEVSEPAEPANSKVAPVAAAGPAAPTAPASTPAAPQKDGAEEVFGFCAGESAEVWSNGRGEWLPCLIHAVFPQQVEADGFTVPPNTIKVESEAGTKYVREGDILQHLRKTDGQQRCPPGPTSLGVSSPASGDPAPAAASAAAPAEGPA